MQIPAYFGVVGYQVFNKWLFGWFEGIVGRELGIVDIFNN